MKKFLALILSVLVLALCAVPALAAGDNGGLNRYNIVIVSDASGSMEHSDRTNLRYEALAQFIYLLTEKGNYLGSVIFSDGILDEQAAAEVGDSAWRDNAIGNIRENGFDKTGWTNTGLALDRAVDMLEEGGDPSLPSVIILLSDGNTELPDDEDTEVALEQKADAIERARQDNIAVYSVCLNVDNSADVSEMQQMADATGGAFVEINSAEDLSAVMDTFYQMIYGSYSVTLVDETFPADGEMDVDFTVPGIGVEEINVILYGSSSGEVLYGPDGEQSDAEIDRSETFTLIKQTTDVTPGDWRLHVEGVPGDKIRINLVYNTNLTVDIAADPSDEFVNPSDPIEITAKLSADGVTADTDEQYIGYEAELVITDAYGDTVDTVPMQVEDGCFRVSQQYDEGTYNYAVRVSNDYFEKYSDTLGPVTVTADAQSMAERGNAAPYPVEDELEYRVNIWPIFGKRPSPLVIELDGLAQDDQNDELTYRITGTSFIEGTDYTADADTITMDHYSLKKGSFTVSATDPYGLSCDIEIHVVTRNIALITVIVLGALVLIALILIGLFLWRSALAPFMGTLYVNGSRVELNGRGKFRLQSTGVDTRGMAGYFQATGKNYIYFVSRKKVYNDFGATAKKIKLSNGWEQTVYRTQEDKAHGNGLRLRFESLIGHR